jgi:hypothetical protein
MKQVLLIGGGLAVVGGLAYLYLKNKKKQEAILTGGTSATQPSATTPIVTTPTGATSSATDGGLTGGSMIVTSKTTASNSEEQAKLDTAKDIEAKINNYYKASASQQRLNLMKPKGIFAISSNSNPYPFLIKKLKDELKVLGYEYKGQIDGVLVKI